MFEKYYLKRASLLMLDVHILLSFESSWNALHAGCQNLYHVDVWLFLWFCNNIQRSYQETRKGNNPDEFFTIYINSKSYLCWYGGCNNGDMSLEFLFIGNGTDTNQYIRFGIQKFTQGNENDNPQPKSEWKLEHHRAWNTWHRKIRDIGNV